MNELYLSLKLDSMIDHMVDALVVVESVNSDRIQIGFYDRSHGRLTYEDQIRISLDKKGS